jgi:hypothetical protein
MVICLGGPVGGITGPFSIRGLILGCWLGDWRERGDDWGNVLAGDGGGCLEGGGREGVGGGG